MKYQRLKIEGESTKNILNNFISYFPRRTSNTLGFTLVEVLVFVTVLAMFFVVAAAVAITSMRNMKVNEHKILATRYSEELLEWLRAKREIDWVTFYGRASSGAGTTYCFNVSPIADTDISSETSGWPSAGICSSPPSGLNPAIYNRTVTLTRVGSDQVNVAVKVSWSEFGNSYSIPINTLFAVWE